MYAALDLHERSIQCVLKDDTGKIVRESKMGKDEERILEFLDGTQASVVMSRATTTSTSTTCSRRRGTTSGWPIP